MNLLSQVVPGLRDFRTPAIVGSLWVLAGFLTYLLLPTVEQQNIASAMAQFRSSTSSLKSYEVAILGTGVYIVGVTSLALVHMIAAPLRAFAALAAQEEPGGGMVGGLIALIMLLSVGLIWKPFIPVLVLLIVAAISTFVIVLAKQTDGDVRQEFRNLLRAIRELWHSIPEAVVASEVRWYTLLQPAFSSYRQQVNLLAAEEGIRWYENDPIYLKNRLSSLDNRAFARAYLDLCEFTDDLGARVHKLADSAGTDIEAGRLGDVRRIATVLELGTPESKTLAGELQAELVKRFIAATAARRREFVAKHTLTNVDFIAAEERFQHAQVRVKAHQPTIYDEYDRRRAEAEFRTSISLPLACTVSLFAVLLHRSLTPDGIAQGWFVAVGVIPLILFLSDGRRKRIDASRWMFAAVRLEIGDNVPPDSPPILPSTKVLDADSA